MLHLNGVLGGGPGEVHVGGLRVEKANMRECRRRVGIVFQDPDDQLFMPTVAQDVAFGPANELLADEALMTANRLELPFGFDARRFAP